jgi:hypothetical protein
MANLIKVYPNPFSEAFRIEAEQLLMTGIELFDHKGILVKQINIFPPAHSFSCENISLPPGFYILAIETDQGWVHKKIEIRNRN